MLVGRNLAIVATPEVRRVAMVRRHSGVAPQVEKREEFARLIAQGVSNRRACQLVGIARKTGTRWRLGRTITTRDGRTRHYPPVVNGPSQGGTISARYLSEDERVRIADLRRAGHTVRAIAAESGRSPSTISRELRRNRDEGSGQYRPFAAQRLAAERRSRPGRGKLVNDAALQGFVAERLKKRWSPEQISHALRVEVPDRPQWHLVPETIYQAVYRPELGGLVREFPDGLRTGRRRRRRRRHPDARRAGSPRDDDDRPAPSRGRRPLGAGTLGG